MSGLMLEAAIDRHGGTVLPEAACDNPTLAGQIPRSALTRPSTAVNSLSGPSGTRHRHTMQFRM
jgi:hypothetical protein